MTDNMRFIPCVEEIESRFTPATMATNPGIMATDAMTPVVMGSPEPGSSGQTTDGQATAPGSATDPATNGPGGTGGAGATPAPPTSTTGNPSDGTAATGTSGTDGSTSAGFGGSGTSSGVPFFSGSSGGFGGGLFVVNTGPLSQVSTGVPNGSTPVGGSLGTPSDSLGDTNGRAGTIDTNAGQGDPATGIVTDPSTQLTTTGAITGTGAAGAGGGSA